MYHLDNESGVSTFALAPVKNTQRLWFTEGGHGNAISYPGADWFNMVQAELLSILDDAGIQPNKGQLNQISLAIRKLSENKVEDFSQNLKQADGYKLVGRCKSVAELRTIRPTEHGQRILVDAYYEGGTTGGGEFVADLQDMITPDDGGVCFVVENNGGRWKRISSVAAVEDFGAKGDKQTDDSAAFKNAAAYAKRKKVPFVAQGKYKLTQVINLREVEVQAGSCDILLEGDGQLILGGHANSGFNPVQTLGKAMVAKLVLDPAPYTRPTIRCIGAKNQIITVKSTNYMQLYMSTDPATFPADASIAYSTFNLNFVLKLEIATDPRFDGGENRDGAGSANQWCNENIFNLNRCWALILSGSYRHNCNYFLGGSFEGAKAFIDVQTGNKNQFIHTRLESVGWVRFGENTSGNVISRAYFSSLSHVPLNVEDHGVLNRFETAALENGQVTRVLDVNPFSVRFNHNLLDTEVSQFIRATKHYGTIAESEVVRMEGRKDILIFNTDNQASSYQVRVYVFDKDGKVKDLSQLEIDSNFIRYEPEYQRLTGTMRGNMEYGIYRLLLKTPGEHYVKIMLAASKNKDEGVSRYFTVDLYSDRVRHLPQYAKSKICVREPTQYIGFKGDKLNCPTGQITVVEHIHSTIMQKQSQELTLTSPVPGSSLKQNDLVGIENEGGQVFWSKIRQLSDELIQLGQVKQYTIQLTDTLPEWVSVGDKLYISRFEPPTKRYEYSRQIKGTAAGYTENTVDVTGMVTLYPDGRIEQSFRLSALHYSWFISDRGKVGTHLIPVNLWTAMPNKVTKVIAKSMTGSSDEWLLDWALHKQNESKGWVFINVVQGKAATEHSADLYVIVEGY